ncbi:AAA family ATPase [Kordiimonas sediminis]|uniref:AAA family ATPase n=1 Tax=Kordiimonas sediminis TaxID=1735581 RepID=UPI00174C87A3|nr:AAA family ATPase [Kordiimonas sediminis]
MAKDALYQASSGDPEAYKAFLEKFPATAIGHISLDDYCIGDNSAEKQTFCWYIERGLQGAFGLYTPGTSRGHLIYKENSGDLYVNRLIKAAYPDPEEALQYTLHVHQAVAQLHSIEQYGEIEDAKIFDFAGVEPVCSIGDSRKIRLLSIYHPEWVVPINSTRHLSHFIKILAPDDAVPATALQRSAKLTEIYNAYHAEVPELTTYGFMKALYSDELGIRPTKEKANSLVIKLTKGAIKNGYISLRKDQSFFDPDFFCASSDEPSSTFMMELPDGESLECWCLSDHGRIRNRFTRLFRDHDLEPGDEVHISVEDEDENLFRMNFVKRNLFDLEYLKAKFLHHMQGFTTFSEAIENQTAYCNERLYKVELVTRYQDMLHAGLKSSGSDTALKETVFDGLVELSSKSLPETGVVQNLWDWRTMSFLGAIRELGRKEGFVDLWRALILGAEPDIARIESFNTGLAALLEGSSENVQRPALTRDIPLFLLMLAYPDKYSFLKTTALEKAFASILKKSGTVGHIDEAQLKLLNKLYRKTMEILEDWGWEPQDLLDAQSFLWVVFSYDDADVEQVETVAAVSAAKERFMPALNTILYGPPGTGKTYNTINKAVNLIDPDFSGDRAAYKKTYDEYVAAGQIRFVTFHQSFSYEDFVEGIKPVEGEDGQLTYPPEAGVFKEICEEASAISISVGEPVDVISGDVWKMSLGNTQGDDAEIYNECIDNGYVLLGYGDDIDFAGCDDRGSVHERFKDAEMEVTKSSYPVSSVNTFKNRIKQGDLIIVSDGNLKFRAIGRVNGDYRFLDEAGRGAYLQSRSVEWLFVSEKSLPYDRIMHTAFSQMTLYQPTARALSKEKLSAFLNQGTSGGDNRDKNYVLIIDEINRGNISRIFGELITLIEDDKRAGTENEQSVVLPYSKKPFSVPENLYLLGTMNTADRSLAGIDIALRRRFHFEEMMPRPDLLRAIAGIDLNKMLTAMNERIEVLLGRDYMIGHSYFINVNDGDGLGAVSAIFANKVIPLLQEYFFEDWEHISWVLNDHRKSDDTYRFIRKVDKSGKSIAQLFGNLDGLDESQDKRWKVNKEAFGHEQSFVQIYTDYRDGENGD